MSDEYTKDTAHAIAARIVRAYGPQILDVAALSGFPAWWFVGLTGMENPHCYEWPDPRSVRFEKNVYSHLLNVLNGRLGSWSGVRQDMVKGAGDDTLRALATSYGQTQIMGYYVLTVLNEFGLLRLKDPAQHYTCTATMFANDPRIIKRNNANTVPAMRDLAFKHVAHIWNSGREWDGTPEGIRTYSPHYMDNCLLVGREAEPLLQAANNERLNRKADLLIKQQDITDVGPGATDTGPRDVFGEAGSQDKVEAPPTGDERKDDDMATGNRATGNSVAGTTVDGYAVEPATPNIADPQSTDNPIIGVKPGYQTSEGQLTALFVVVSGVLALFGWKYSPDTVGNWYSAALALGKIVGPLVMAAPVMWNYLTSRGKTKSNAINATAAVQMAQTKARSESQTQGDNSDTLVDMTHPTVQSFLGTNRVISGLLGGANWKDPQRYVALAKIFGDMAPLPPNVSQGIRRATDVAQTVIAPDDVKTPGNSGNLTAQRAAKREELLAQREKIAAQLRELDSAVAAKDPMPDVPSH